MWDAARDIFCGTMAGITSKFVDYPFDTVKTRLQAEGHPYKGTVDCIRSIVRDEGLHGFYNGITAPIGGAIFENAGAFLFYGRGVSWYKSWAGVPEASATPMTGVILAGAFSGIATGTVLTPVELLKCNVQIEQQNAAKEKRVPKYKGVVDCGVQTLKRGGFKALFTGYSATLSREVPGNAAWFGFYEATLRFVFTPEGKTKDDCAWYAYPIRGGIGGFWYWTAFYPADVVKTRMQVDPVYGKNGLVWGFRHMLKTEGIRALYNGYGITVCRSFPANATIFATYELVSKKWKGFFNEA